MRTQGSWVGPLYELCPDSEYKIGQIIGNISYNLKLNEKLSIIPKIYADYICHDYYLQEHTDGYIKGTSIFIDGAITKEKYNGITLGSEILANYDINDNLEILSGLVYENLSVLDYSILRKNTDDFRIFIRFLVDEIDEDIYQKAIKLSSFENIYSPCIIYGPGYFF